MIKEFLAFLKEFNVISLATAIVMGTAATALVNSLVKDVIMPIINPLFSPGNWEDMVIRMGPVHIAAGSFLAALINFVILAAIVFIVAKKMFKLELPKK